MIYSLSLVQSFEMNLLVSVVFVYFFSTPAFSYYANNDKSGYVSLSNAKRFAKSGLRAMQRRYFFGSSRKNYDNIIDSHFKIMKTAPIHHASIQRDNPIPELTDLSRWNTESPNNRIRNEDTMPNVNSQAETSELRNQPNVKPIKQRGEIKPITQSQIQNPHRYQKPRLNSEYIHQASSQDFQSGFFSKDTKPNFVKVNVHRMPISTDPQKSIRKVVTDNNNIQNNNNRNNVRYNIAPQPIYQPEKKLHRSNSTSATVNIVTDERSFKATTQDLPETSRHNGISHKPNNAEKRETVRDRRNDDIKAKRNVLSDTMRKYIGNKDRNINVERNGNKEYSKIGSHEDAIQSRDNPYAIFYKMHPASLAKQHGPVSLEEYYNIFSAIKPKSLSNFANEIIDFKSPLRHDLHKKIKLHKKVKNYRSVQNS